MKRKVEVFTANCPICDPVVQMINEASCENCDVTIHDVVKKYDSKECVNKLNEYNIHKIPAIVVDGKPLDCCKDREITREDLKNAGIGN